MLRVQQSAVESRALVWSSGRWVRRRNVIHGGSSHLTGQKVLNADSFGSATHVDRAPVPSCPAAAWSRCTGPSTVRKAERRAVCIQPPATSRDASQSRPLSASQPAAVTFPPRPPRLAAGRARSWSSCRVRRRRRPGARRCAGQRSESARRRSHRSGVRSGRPERAVWQR